MTRRNLIPKISVAGLLSSIAYFLFFARYARLTTYDIGDSIDWNVVMFQIVPSASIALNLLVGIVRSSNDRDYGWLVGMLLLFPFSFVYTLFVNPGRPPASEMPTNQGRGHEC